jgi:hypothetical protein
MDTLYYSYIGTNDSVVFQLAFPYKLVNVQEVTIQNLPESICNNGTPVLLTGSPTGGTFYVNGSVNPKLNPGLFNPGKVPVEYRYVSSSGNCAINVKDTVFNS